MKKILRPLLLLLLLVAATAGYYWHANQPPTALTLTGIVTTNEVVVSPQIGGRISRLLVTEGDQVQPDQLLAVLAPDELREEREFYSRTAEGAGSQVIESEAALRLQQRQTDDQIAQAEATLAATESEQMAAEAQLENTRITLDRMQRMIKDGVVAQEQLDTARTAHDVARSRIAALARQIDAQKAAVALARANAEQVSIRRSQVLTTRQQQAAAAAQRAKADVRLAYTELHAPIAGIVDVRAARTGEVVNAGTPVVTIIDPDDLWIRADVEESYIDKVRVGDTIKVRLPSGDMRDGKVVFRGVDAGYATQRDVSRTKRDIKTFEIRVKVDNADRRLAVGMTAYVLLPLEGA